MFYFFFFSSRRRHTRLTCDWSSDVCSSDLSGGALTLDPEPVGLLHVGRDLRAVQAISDAWRATHPATRPEVVTADELRRLEPALADDLVACRLRIGYPVAPAAATLAFAAEAEHAGAKIVIGQEARLVIR